LSEIGNLDDIGVVDRCGSSSFLNEPCAKLGFFRQVTPKNLHGKLALKGSVFDSIHRTHAALSEVVEDLVTVIDNAPNERVVRRAKRFGGYFEGFPIEGAKKRVIGESLSA
jgi:hypothetical protein